MAAFIILHQAVFLLACVFLNEFAVFPILLQRPAEVTREYIDAYFAAPDAPEVILYGLQFFELASWAAFVLWALGNIVPWRELAPKEKKTDAAAMAACAALMLIMCIYFRFFYGGAQHADFRRVTGGFCWRFQNERERRKARAAKEGDKRFFSAVPLAYLRPAGFVVGQRG